MKRQYRRLMMLLGLLLLGFILAACAKKTNGNEASGYTNEKQDIVLSEDMQKLLQETDWGALDNGEWQDNTLDPWEATAFRQIKFKGEEGLVRYGREADDFCLTPGGVSVFLSRASGDSDGQSVYLMERVRCSHDGKAEDLILAKGQNLAKPEIMAYGIVSGTEELWGSIRATQELPQQLFWQLNDDSTIQSGGKGLAIRFLGEDCDSESVDQFILDKDGLIYLLTTKMKYHRVDGALYLDSSENYLYVVSSQGECLLAKLLTRENKDTAEPAFVPLPGGKVGISMFDGEGSERKLTLYGYDGALGDLKTLAALENTYLTNYAIALSNAGTVISADSGGIWEKDMNGGEAKELYTWKNHGMRPQAVYAINASEENMIDLVFQGGDGLHYLSLRPVDQNRQITELVMVATESTEKRCKAAATKFNQKYPNYHLEIKTGYDSTRLLSELIAGDGPVLVDTTLTGFATQRKLWEPLDGVFEAMGLSDALVPQAMEYGQIDGVTYGVVADFTIETLITYDAKTQNWDYEAFLNYLQEHSDRPYVYEDYDANHGGLFVYRFWQHGLDDGFLLNGSAKESYIDTDRFRSILKIADAQCQNEGKLNDKDKLTRLRDGDESFHLVYFFKPTDLALFRIAYGKDAVIAGEPMQTGSANLIVGGNEPITIRNTATLDEKKGALLFFWELLSHDNQEAATKEIDFHFSVRKDVLKEAIMKMDEDSWISSNGYLCINSSMKLGDKLDRNQDYQRLLELLEHSVPKRYLPNELSNVLWDELEPYFDGTVDQEKMIKQLNNRVGLYLQEQ
ncbi:MAG: hypothetical protein IKS85_03150 [Lachnospiraceae bacterium]|nr:hypothetical protein [Lachnospiraceae bacterium]